MQPIINPIWFYIIELISTVSSLLVVIPIVLGALFLFIEDNKKDNLIDIERDKWHSKIITEIDYHEFKLNLKEIFVGKLKKIVITIIICLTVASLLPSPSTVTKMLIASQITEDRVDKGVEVVERVYNDILNRIDQKETK